jgi:hypothetical protein
MVTMLGILFVYSGVADAQKHMAKTTSVTGCLEKGTVPNEYQITAEGKTYKLTTTSNVNLAEHVGHKVTVTGHYMAESSGAKSSSSTTTESNELNVTYLKHISNTCQR